MPTKPIRGFRRSASTPPSNSGRIAPEAAGNASRSGVSFISLRTTLPIGARCPNRNISIPVKAAIAASKNAPKGYFRSRSTRSIARWETIIGKPGSSTPPGRRRIPARSPSRAPATAAPLPMKGSIRSGRTCRKSSAPPATAFTAGSTSIRWWSSPSGRCVSGSTPI